ncbi:MAG: hypothetical protein U0744_11850 [Gemmataceae bacterium]
MRFEDKGIYEVSASPSMMELFFAAALQQCTDRVRTALVSEIASRLRFLREVGSRLRHARRPAVTLSRIAERIRIATQLGGGLLGVCCILDSEPTGLHPQDIERLLAVLRPIAGTCGTLLVVEHDEADATSGLARRRWNRRALQRPHPSATAGRTLANPDSVTAPYLRGDIGMFHRARLPVADDSPAPTIFEACNIALEEHRRRPAVGSIWIAIAGVMSGKSSLVRERRSCSAVRRNLYGMLAPPPAISPFSVETSLLTCLNGFADPKPEAPTRQDNHLVAVALFCFDKIIEVIQPLGRPASLSALIH